MTWWVGAAIVIISHGRHTTAIENRCCESILGSNRFTELKKEFLNTETGLLGLTGLMAFSSPCPDLPQVVVYRSFTHLNARTGLEGA